jgi:Phage integrase, N-terminal SAM-like domain
MNRGRPLTGSVMKPTAKQPRVALRFTADGKRRYITLGRPEDGWTLVRAERELAIVLRDVELGTWRPAEPDTHKAPEAEEEEEEEEEEEVYFLLFAAEWLDAKLLEVAPETASNYRSELRNHLIPYFKDHLVKAIDIKEIRRVRRRRAGRA